MGKKTVAVLFGGQSSEHNVSLVSATFVIKNLLENYCVMPIGITKEGQWLLYNGPVENIQNGQWERFGTPAIISPDACHKGIIRLSGDKYKVIPVDVFFPVLHGKFGEDGTIQGLLELNQVPYVGCGVFASSASMDKVYTKIIAAQMGIEQAKYKVVLKETFKAEDLADIESLGYPVFVKPSNAGSSVGISKAANREALKAAIELAFQHDRKVLVEESITGRELECAVLGNLDAEASVIGEIVAAAEFYDYEAKYHNQDSKTIVPADLDAEISSKIQQAALAIFKAVDGRGLSRVDFFLEEGTGRIIFNEINTLPGFTGISMYPMLWAYMEKGGPALVDRLVQLALNKNEAE